MADQVKASNLTEAKRTKSPINSFQLKKITKDEI